jgi:Asp-tRNA(Asn)/Glu-tRNA(Gln) amidotransferase A subunit family amidase
MKKSKAIGRRGFMKAVPAAVAAGVTLPKIAAGAAPPKAVLPQGGRGGPAPRFGQDALKGFEKVAGLDFTDKEEEAVLRGVSNNLGSYEELRKLDVPLDTEPAITFRPYLPGKQPTGRSTRNAKLAVSKSGRIQVSASLEQLAFAPVTELAPLIESKRITSTDLTKMYLGRLKKYGDQLHCVITLTEDLALAQAAAADKEIKSGHYRGALHGIPWGAKDLFDTKGINTTWGAKPFKDRVPDIDATIVERLRDAGAVLCAKLSMGSLAQGGVWFGGSTRNPWAPDSTSSGSSAGPGAATSAGLVGFAIGTETRGSIISPSSTCGVVGLRPTYGRISRYGAMALSWTMDKIGPMCRSVEDCALVFNAIYGADHRDETVVDAPFNWNPDVPLSSLKIGYVKREFELAPPNPTPAGGGGGGGGRGGLSPEEARKRAEERNKLLNDALDAMRSAGAKLEPMELPEFPANALSFLLTTEGAAAFDDATRSRELDKMNDDGPDFGSSWPNSFRQHRFVPAVEYIRGQRARTLLMRKMDALMANYDVFLSSTNSASLGITNLTGHPAMCLKAGFAPPAFGTDPAPVPIALMLTGRLYDEATLLRVGLAYERATKWHEMNPPLDENLKKMKTVEPEPEPAHPEFGFLDL